MTASRSPHSPYRCRHRAARVLLAAALLLLAACGGGGGSVPGGATSLPGPLPEGVAYHDPSEEAPRAPEFTVDLIDGTEIRSGDLWDDRPVVLLFTSSWCRHCAEQHAELAEFVAGYDGAVTLLAVAGEDERDDVVEYARELGVEHPVAMEADDAWLKYAVREPPLVALVAQGGQVVRGWPGGFDADALAEELDALVSLPDGS